MQKLDAQQQAPELELRLLQDVPAEASAFQLRWLLFEIVRLSDRQIVGRCDLRAGENAGALYAGNVGFEIAPAFRGRHYARKACLLLFDAARELGMTRLLISCAPDNLPSRRTCQELGPAQITELPLPEWHSLYSDARQSSIQYLFNL